MKTLQLKPSLLVKKCRQLLLVLGQTTVLFHPSGISDPANTCRKVPFQVVPPARTAAMAGAGMVRWAHAQILIASRRFICSEGLLTCKCLGTTSRLRIQLCISSFMSRWRLTLPIWSSTQTKHASGVTYRRSIYCLVAFQKY